MKPFATLKIYEDKGYYKPVTKHQYGGTDTLNIARFLHIYQDLEGIPFVWRELLFDLADAHNWEVVILDSDKP